MYALSMTLAGQSVKRSEYMPEDFKEATDQLFQPISHAKLAEYLECSVATVRQARLPVTANAHRNAPVGWELEVAELAEWEGYRLLGLAKALRKQRRK